VDTRVLDLCTFRTDGRAVCVPEPESGLVPAPLTHGVTKRREVVKKAMRQRLEQVDALADLPTPKRGPIVKALLRADAADAVTHTRRLTRLTYRLKRVARLNPVYADAALAAFSAERSRQAQDFDLDRFVA
ncbi:MAG: hypothetical protein JWR63_623, partial [Conexibacter sp.]|nr:hypothetical protein [Conexibacter sp.]